ncbi:iron-containing alcohol dehydrogenase [Reyranella sp.]|uniref:iron-containing alcohol dehydrogenase n=1 Tax=Reyranella sp. TaxID=1929291 RepID=UPI003D0E0717
MAILSYLTTTHFDFGAVRLLPKELEKLGVRRPLLATDKGVRAAGLLDVVLGTLNQGGALPVFDDTPPNPTEAATLSAFELYRSAGCDGVIGLGGGSAMDLGKAVALLAGSGGPLDRYDPLTGGARHIAMVAPIVAIPTTSGTGSEVSVGFVIVMNDGRKLTFASPKMIPRVAICDPELTLGLPPALTAATGMDAVTHCIEAILSPVVNPPAEGIGYDGLRRAWRHIEAAVRDGADRDARWHMMMASTEGAMAFVKGLGAVHSMSHAAGRLPKLKLHHGTLNAVILPTILRFNEGVSPEKYERLAEAMGLPKRTDLAEAVTIRNRELGLPSGLAAMGVTDSMVADLVPHAVADLSTRTNPRPADAAAYTDLFTAAL